jgi:diguanylate cyclase (GGDEF)-like protein
LFVGQRFGCLCPGIWTVSPLQNADALARAMARSLKGLTGTPYARMSLTSLLQAERELLPFVVAAAEGDAEPLVTKVSALGPSRREIGVRIVEVHRAIRACVRVLPAGGWTPTELARIEEALEEAEQAALIEFERELERSHSTDYLTGLANRRSFMARLQQELLRSRRQQSDFALALMDVDDLKPVNDTLGHAAGDLVLQELASTLRAQCRIDVDLPARIGGDEFACILIGASKAGAESAVSRIGESFGVLALANGQRPSISWGVTGWRKGDSAAALMRRADHALYRMKRGRNPAVT